jgi:hypothetical protein
MPRVPFREYPLGRDGAGLWAPYAAAKDAVERYPQDPQEPGCEVSMIRHDPQAGLIEFLLSGLKLPSQCGRFASRACPRMAPMGHEASHESCNYWDYPRMQEFAPRLELYPEWQRFDCHKFYPLFQAHLVGSELASALKCRLRVIAPDTELRLLSAYAALCSDPSAFSAAF